MHARQKIETRRTSEQRLQNRDQNTQHKRRSTKASETPCNRPNQFESLPTTTILNLTILVRNYFDFYCKLQKRRVPTKHSTASTACDSTGVFIHSRVSVVANLLYSTTSDTIIHFLRGFPYEKVALKIIACPATSHLSWNLQQRLNLVTVFSSFIL